jgi:hypothetical protein
MAETVYTLMLATTSHVVSAGAVHALRAAAATGRPTLRIVPMGGCSRCATPHTAVEIALADVRAIVRHDPSGAFSSVSASSKVVPLRRFATG